MRSDLIVATSPLWLPEEYRFAPAARAGLDEQTMRAALRVVCPVCGARRQSACSWAQQFAVSSWIPHEARIRGSWIARAHWSAEIHRRHAPPTTVAPRTWFVDFFGSVKLNR